MTQPVGVRRPGATTRRRVLARPVARGLASVVAVMEREVVAAQRQPPHVEVAEEVRRDAHAGRAVGKPPLVIGRSALQLEEILTKRGASRSTGRSCRVVLAVA